MIYKFIEPGVHETEMEVYLIDAEDADMGNGHVVVIDILNPTGNNDGTTILNTHHMTKSEVFKLIGALHLLHKEMK